MVENLVTLSDFQKRQLHNFFTAVNTFFFNFDSVNVLKLYFMRFLTTSLVPLSIF